MPFDLGKHHEPSDRFVKAWGVAGPKEEVLKPAFTIGVKEWDRRHKSSERTKTGFLVAQSVAPVAAATATVLAVTGISEWAVIPSAIATVVSSLLASFGLRENWARLRLVTRALAFELVNFAQTSGSYRQGNDDARIDAFMKRIEELSMHSLLEPKKPRNGGPREDESDDPAH